MRQITLNLGLRLLLGVLGAVAVVASVAVAAVEVRSAARGSPLWPAIFLLTFCLVIACGGALLLEGAWRGRINVRDPRAHT